MNHKMNILLVFGTRPETIKVAPVIDELKRFPDYFNCKVCVTGQHREMIDPLLKTFDIHADYDLNIMQANQKLEYITSRVLQEIGKIIDKDSIDYLLVQGDTTTAMAASLASFYRRVKVGHIEAGLRTWDKFHPYPEEVNRKIIDSLSDLYFAHTAAARQNLINEGVAKSKIEVTGNTVIDALLNSANREYHFDGSALGRFIEDNRKLVLVTAHRRENFGQPITNICQALKEIALSSKDEVKFIYPVHLNPNIKKPAYSILDNIENILLTKPLEYLPFVHLIKRAHMILTDSGGLQEEAPSLGKPVLVMRQTTERPEGVEAGCVEVIGTQTDDIVTGVKELLNDASKFEKMSKSINPYGDGQASRRIVQRLLKEM